MSSRNKYNWYLFGIAAAGFLLRLVFLRFLPGEGGNVFVFSQPDAYYHVRRSMLFAVNFPSLDVYDYYLSYPEGSSCPWPPLYDWCIAMFSLASAAGRPDIRVITFFHAVTPPLLACLAVIPLSKLVLITWNNRKLALWSAFYLMLVPGLYGYSHIGAGDHHAAETFLSIWFFYWCLRTATDQTGRKGTGRIVAGTGLTLALGMTIWQGFAIYCGLGMIFIMTVLFIRRDDGSAMRLTAARFAAALACAAALTAILRVLVPLRLKEELFNFDYFSYFHPAFVAALGGGILLWPRILVFWQKAGARTKWSTTVVAAAVTAVLVYYAGFDRVAAFFLREEPYLKIVNETKPIHQAFAIRMPDSYDPAENFFLLLRSAWVLWYLLPVLYAAGLVRAAVRSGSDRTGPPSYWLKTGDVLSREGTVLFITVTLILGGFTMLQKRWSNAYSPWMAIVLGLFTFTLLHDLSIVLREKGGSLWTVIRTGLSVLMLLVFFHVCTGILMSRDEAYPMDADQYATLEWIRTNTPKTSYLYDPGRKPEYSIIASWDSGHPLLAVAERPVMTSNFAYIMPGDNYRDSNRLWESPAEDSLVRIFEKYGGKFFLVTAGDDLSYFESPVSLYLDKGALYKNDLASRFSLPVMRLMAYDGSSSPFGGALSRFRLVYESRTIIGARRFPVEGIKKHKLYELVKGAQVTGYSVPGAPVTITGRFSSTLWPRPFVWQTAATADSKGRFNVRVPYATIGGNYSIAALSAFIADNGTVKKAFNVSTRDVAEGREVSVNLSGR